MAGSRVERMFEEALTALRKMRYNQAYDLFTEAMELEPEMPEIHYNRGIAAAQLYRWEDAAQCFKLAARISPHPDYLVRLGLAYLHLRRWREAQEEFEAALELEPGNEVAQTHLSDVRFYLERFRRAASPARPSAPAGSIRAWRTSPASIR